MTGLLPFRSLNSVMVATMHVAVVSYVFRSFLSPSNLAGPSVVVWVPLSILVSLFLSMPMGRAVAAAFPPGDEPSERACPRCRLGELRPLVRTHAGLFAPITGYRCSGCGTTFRPVGEAILEEATSDRGATLIQEGVRIVDGPPPADLDPSGIRFLDEPGPSSTQVREAANMPARSVSDV